MDATECNWCHWTEGHDMECPLDMRKYPFQGISEMAELAAYSIWHASLTLEQHRNHGRWAL